jgi:hypothetical protein
MNEIEDPPWEPPKCEYCNRPITDVRKHYTECRLAHTNAVIKKKNEKSKLISKRK